MQVSGALSRVLRLKNLAGGSGVASVFVLKAVITGLNFALVTLAARALGLEVFGSYSLLFSAAGLTGIAATFGQQVLVMRVWNEYLAAGRPDLLKGALIFSVAACLVGCVLLGVPFYLWCASAHSSAVAAAATAYMVLMALVMTSAHLVRTAVSVEIGDGFANVLLIAPGAAYVGFCLLSGTGADLALLFGVMAGGASLAILIHGLALGRALARACPSFAAVRPQFETAQWIGRSARLFTSSALEAANQYLDVLMIGFFLDPATAGAWFVLTRVANVISVATDAIHMFATRHIPQLYYRKQFAELDRILDTVGWVTLTMIAGSIAGIVVAGGLVLSIFGPAYAGQHGLLIVLSLGAAATAAAGPSSSMLMLTGHEGRYLGIIGSSVLLRIAGFAALIPAFGVAGAAAAVSLALVTMALLLRQSAKSCTGIEASVLRLLRFRPREAMAAPQEQS